MKYSILRFFAYQHLPPNLQKISKEFYELSKFLANNLEDAAEAEIALRKLLEAKDAAVRAQIPMPAPEPPKEDPEPTRKRSKPKEIIGKVLRSFLPDTDPLRPGQPIRTTTKPKTASGGDGKKPLPNR